MMNNYKVAFLIMEKFGVEEAAFEETTIKEIIFPPFLKKIGKYAFFNCTELVDVNFMSPSSCEEIGIGAFSGCSSLKTFLAPESITLINKYAFSECSSLEMLIIPSDKVLLGYEIVRECPIAKIMVISNETDQDDDI